MADPSNSLFGLAEGVVGVYLDAGCAMATLGFIAYPGWWGGSVSVADGTSRRATVVARTPVTFLSVPRSHVEALARDMPESWRHVATCCASHFDNLSMLLLAHLHERPEMRVMITLRRLHLFNDGVTEFRVSQAELAEMAGLSRKTANRAIRKIAADGVIETTYGRVRIVDPARIETALTRAHLPVWACAKDTV